MKSRILFFAAAMTVIATMYALGASATLSPSSAESQSAATVYLPVVLNNVCGSPYIDDFSDSNSGWPIENFSEFSLSYYNNEYRIFFDEVNWDVAATAGFRWEDAQQVQVKGRIATGDGDVGIVYGIADDWSTFYTFEVLPYYDEWYVFRYTTSSGWTLINYGSSSAITSGSNTLALTRSGTNVRASVNGVFLTNVPNQAGRVGVYAYSFSNNADLRFDDFVFVAHNCPLPAQATILKGANAVPMHGSVVENGTKWENR